MLQAYPVSISMKKRNQGGYFMNFIRIGMQITLTIALTACCGANVLNGFTDPCGQTHVSAQ